VTVDGTLYSSPPRALPNAEQLHSYLRFTGWRQLPPGPAGSFWVRDSARIGVPHENDEFMIKGSIERIAKSERRTLKEVYDSVRFLLFDVVHLRAANDRLIADTIPLEAASKILSSSKRMLQATATTARAERAHIGTNFSRRGNEVVRHTLMGHTERGSFVIPVLVPLPEPSPLDFHEDTLLEEVGDGESYHRSAPEPFERRVVRTFAQSMQAVNEIVVEPAKIPSVDQIYELVYRGVSREFCTSLSGILKEPSVAEFGATIDWAPVVTPPRTFSPVTIDATAADLVQNVADKLRQTRMDPSQVFTGTIVQLRHESQIDPFGEIAVSTVRRGRQSEVIVRLPIDQYQEAWQWHYDGRAVLVEGVVRRAPNQPLRVDSPIRFHPVDEMFLSE
jgi:hypothetical protein